MKTKSESKPVVIAEGKLVLSGRKFQYILQDGVKKFVYGDSCIKMVIVITLLSLSSCLTISMDDDYQRIDPLIKPYVDSFVAEARIRNVQIDISKLKISFGDLHGEAAGRSYFDGSNMITIDPKGPWTYAPECLVFHELGHLILRREHDDSWIGFYPKSIMAGPFSPFYESTAYLHEREYYVDELFNPNTPRPSWSY